AARRIELARVGRAGHHEEIERPGEPDPEPRELARRVRRARAELAGAGLALVVVRAILSFGLLRARRARAIDAVTAGALLVSLARIALRQLLGARALDAQVGLALAVLLARLADRLLFLAPRELRRALVAGALAPALAAIGAAALLRRFLVGQA